jgi:hypothetical protein
VSGGVFVAIIAGVASIIAGLLGPWFAFRAARSGQAQTRSIEQQKVDQSQADSWREDVTRLRASQKEERAEFAERLKALETKLRNESDGKVAILSARIDDMVRKSAAVETKHRRELSLIETRLEGAVEWIRLVVPIMRGRGLEFPAVPPGIVETDPGGYMAIRRATTP